MRHLASLVFAVLISTAVAPAALDPAAVSAARELYGQRENDAALAAFQKLAAADPQHAEPPFYLGLLAMRRDDTASAVKFLEQAVSLDPRSSEYQRRLGDAYGRTAQKAGMLSKLGWARKCLAAYQKAVELDPRSLEARASLLTYYQQAPSIAGGGMPKAYAEAEEIRKIAPARGRDLLANLYVADKKYSQAFALFHEALRDSPDDYPTLYQLGRLSAVTGERLDTGAAALRRCLTLTAPPDQPHHAAVHWRLGNIQEKQGDPTAARASYESALRLDPNFRQARESLAALK